MEVKTYLLGIELVTIEHRTQGWECRVSSLNHTFKLHTAIFMFLEFVDIFGCLSFQEESGHCSYYRKGLQVRSHCGQHEIDAADWCRLGVIGARLLRWS